MKIKKISCSMTRQVQQFQPAVFTMEAEVPEGANPEHVAKELQRLVIRVLYKDSAKLRDSLITNIVDCVEVPKESRSSKDEPNMGNMPNF